MGKGVPESGARSPGRGGLCPSLMTEWQLSGRWCSRGNSVTMTKSKRLPEPTRKLDPSELARLVRENAEALFKDLAGEAFHRAFNPDCPRTPLERERSALPRVEPITGAAVLKVPFDL